MTIADLLGEPQWAKDLGAKLDVVLKNLQAIQLREASEQHQLSTISRKEDAIMTAVQVQQEDLDQLASDLNAAASSLQSEIQALEASSTPLPAGSLDGLKSALSSLQALEVPPTAPTG